MTTNTPTTIIWFFQDLRLGDNAALTWAAARGAVLPVYIRDENSFEGGASKWWLNESLKILAADFAKHKIELILRQGKPLDILRTLIKQSGADAVSWSRRYEPKQGARDEEIAAALRQDDIEVAIHTGFLLFEPEQIRTKTGTMFKVYTPFSKACFAAPSPNRALPVPAKLHGVTNIESDDLKKWNLVPKIAKWPAGLAEAWQPGEEAAGERLHDFIDQALTPYKTARDRPDQPGTSRLSPYLHFGNISPRQVWHALHHAQAHSAAKGPSAERYLLELLWREFSWHLLHGVPDLPKNPLIKSFASFPWREDTKALNAWQAGMTGYPVVDAGMRELWQTGWMHNRVRMITASFLIKDLLIDWRTGMHWFWDTLVDADLGANTASWQWVAGCGADAAPYFRIFNPTLQGEKFDPSGDYVRRYVPELAEMPARYIHEPWKAPAEILAKAGVKLGKTYPLPIVDHAKARNRALEALKQSKGETAHFLESADLFDT